MFNLKIVLLYQQKYCQRNVHLKRNLASTKLIVALVILAHSGADAVVFGSCIGSVEVGGGNSR